MTPLAIIALVTKLVLLYVLTGGIAVVACAFVSAVAGYTWFSPKASQRWTYDMLWLPPVVIFALWPLMIPLSVVYYLGKGFFKAIEVAADKAIELGSKKERILRGGKA